MTEEEARKRYCVPVARALSGLFATFPFPPLEVEHWHKEDSKPPDFTQFWSVFWAMVPRCQASACMQWRNAYKPGHDGFCGLSGGVNTSYGAPPGLEDGPTEPPTSS